MADQNQKKEHWAKTAVIYHIYPRSFQDSNGDGIGDLNGIIEKLDYLNDGTEQSLGVDAIWLSPIYTSPMADFGYDVSDYYSIDPSFGNFETFDRLIAEAHKRNIRVLLDFVANHTSHEHPWFQEARSSRDNPKRGWYIWADPKPDGSPPNNWVSVFGGPAWTFDEKTGQYYLHTYLKEQPDLNWRNAEVKMEFENILEFWLHKGVDGFRADAVDHLMKDAELRDDPENPNYVPGKDDPYNQFLHTNSQGRPEKINTIGAFCEILSKHDNTFMVSETYLDVPGLTEMYKACGNKLHAPLNLNFIGMSWSAENYKKFIDEFETSLEPDDIPNYVLGNHDRHRVVTRLGENRARAAALLIFTLRGVPFIYYGEEIGMTDGEIPPEKEQDPWGKLTPGFGLGRDPERTPMQWTSGLHAGFSEKEPWLPVADRYAEKNVEAETVDPHSMLTLYRHLIHFRKKSSAILRGSYRPLPLQCNGNVFAFLREYQNERALIVLNFSDQACRASFAIHGFETCRVAANTHCDKLDEEMDVRSIPLRAHEGYVFRVWA